MESKLQKEPNNFVAIALPLIVLVLIVGIWISGILPKAYMQSLEKVGNISLMAAFPFVAMYGFFQLGKRSSALITMELLGIFESIFGIAVIVALINWLG